MEDSTAPPTYISEIPKAEGAPPEYTFPTTFLIGGKKTDGPLVTVEQLKGHLGLLRLFHNLREQVVAGKDDQFPAWTKEVEEDRRWAWFVALAAER